MTRLRTLLPLAAAMRIVAGGCSSSTDDGEGDDSSDTTETTADSGGSTSTTADGSDGAGSSEDATATVTLADDTAFDFEMSTCDTNGNDPDKFVVEPGYDLFGKSDDGTQLQLIRAGLSTDKVTANGGMEGGFGTDSDISYNAVDDEDLQLSVDGSSVTGTATMTSLDDTAPFGKSIDVTIEVNC